MLGLTASLAVRLIGLWLVFASQKVVHNARDEDAKFVVPLREEIKDGLTRQGKMQGPAWLATQSPSIKSVRSHIPQGLPEPT